MIFRFDDICINTDMGNAQTLVQAMSMRFPVPEIWWCISPLVSDMSEEKSAQDSQRVFKGVLKAYSDYRHFYKVEKCGIPTSPTCVKLASHGLLHVDHRLLSKESQELSIITSCSLIGTRIFVPPFNKWNEDTEEICKKKSIELVKFEDGWRSAEHHKFDGKGNWYLHPRLWNPERLKGWLECPT